MHDRRAVLIPNLRPSGCAGPDARTRGAEPEIRADDLTALFENEQQTGASSKRAAINGRGMGLAIEQI